MRVNRGRIAKDPPNKRERITGDSRKNRESAQSLGDGKPYCSAEVRRARPSSSCERSGCFDHSLIVSSREFEW